MEKIILIFSVLCVFFSNEIKSQEQEKVIIEPPPFEGFFKLNYNGQKYTLYVNQVGGAIGRGRSIVLNFPFPRHLYGKTIDSAKIQIYGYVKKIVEPFVDSSKVNLSIILEKISIEDSKDFDELPKSEIIEEKYFPTKKHRNHRYWHEFDITSITKKVANKELGGIDGWPFFRMHVDSVYRAYFFSNRKIDRIGNHPRILVFYK